MYKATLNAISRVTLGGLGEASQSCQSKKKQRGFAGLFHAMRASLDTNTTRM